MDSMKIALVRGLTAASKEARSSGSAHFEEGVQSVARDESGQYTISIADRAGKETVMTARPGESDANRHVLEVINTITSSGDIASANYRAMTYIYLLRDQPVTVAGSTDFVVEDILNDTRLAAGQTFAQNGGNWPAGFYRILLTNAAKVQ